MKRVRFLQFLMGIFCLVAVGCGKKKNEKLAQNYYKLSMAELSREAPSAGAELLAYKRALGYIDQALTQAYCAEYLAFKATLLFKLQNFEEADRFFSRALKEKASPVLRGEILNNYACFLAYHKRAEEALAIWHDLVCDEYYLTPEVAYVNQGNLYAAKKEYQQAKSCFLKAIELAPDYLDAHYHLSVLAQQQGDVSLAKNTISAALYVEPHNKGMQLLAHQLGISLDQADNAAGDQKL